MGAFGVDRWLPEEPPHAERIDLDEFADKVLRLKICRSFRSDLTHKLTMLVRAHGGHGSRGVWRASQVLRVSRHTLRRWLKWEAAPGGKQILERIDNAYSEAVRMLAREAAFRRSRRKLP